MKENLDIFFSGLDAQKVVLETGEAKREIIAYFDNAFYDASIGETVLDTTHPRLTCKYDDLRSMKRGMDVYIKGKKFSVLQVQPDGNGMAIVTLKHE